MGASRLPPREEERGESPPQRLKGRSQPGAPCRRGEPVASAPLPGGGEDPCGPHAPAPAPGVPDPREEFSLPQIPGVPGVPGVSGAIWPIGPGFRLRPPEPRGFRESGGHSGGHRVREAKDLWPHWPRGPGLQASGFGLQLQSPNSRLQTSSFNFQLWSSNFKLQTSSFNFQLWSSKFRLQTSNFKFQLWSSDSRLQVSALGFGLQASSFSPGLRASLKPGLMPQESPDPRGKSLGPGVPGVLWGARESRGIQESSGENPLTLEPKVFPDPRGSPLARGSPRIPGKPGSLLGGKLSGSPGKPHQSRESGTPRIPGRGESPLSPGLPGSSGARERERGRSRVYSWRALRYIRSSRPSGRRRSSPDCASRVRAAWPMPRQGARARCASRAILARLARHRGRRG